MQMRVCTLSPIYSVVQLAPTQLCLLYKYAFASFTSFLAQSHLLGDVQLVLAKELGLIGDLLLEDLHCRQAGPGQLLVLLQHRAPHVPHVPAEETTVQSCRDLLLDLVDKGMLCHFRYFNVMSSIRLFTTKTLRDCNMYNPCTGGGDIYNAFKNV